MTAKDRVSRLVIHEAYFDLWGFSVAWIESISKALHDYCDCTTDSCESYMSPACMAVRFQSTDTARIDAAVKKFSRLSSLATAAMHGVDPESICYTI